MLDSAPSTRRAVWDAFLFGYGYFMAGTYWIAISLTVDADKFAWLIPFSLFGLSACFALYFALLGWLYARTKTRSVTANAFLFAALWVIIEYLRSLGIFGFPWNLIGYSIVSIDLLLQAASVVGIFGLSILVMLFVMGVVPMLQGASKRYARRFQLAVILCVLLLLGNAMWIGEGDNLAARERIRIVQPNIEQSMKWEEGQSATIMRTLGALTRIESDAPPPSIIVWPETAVPFVLQASSDWVSHVASWVPDKAILITGAVTLDSTGYGNGLAVITPEASIEARYNKRQLVPFGEFIPLRDVLPIDKIAPGPADFIRGNIQGPIIPSTHAPFQAMICYESAFPWLAGTDSKRPDWLLTITNDAWFGQSAGPHQHFAMSRVRAVEQGLPVVRAANTGISAVIDARGRVIKSLQLGEQGIIDAALPSKHAPTFYAQWGEWPSILVLLTICLLVWAYRKAT